MKLHSILVILTAILVENSLALDRTLPIWRNLLLRQPLPSASMTGPDGYDQPETGYGFVDRYPSADTEHFYPTHDTYGVLKPGRIPEFNYPTRYAYPPAVDELPLATDYSNDFWPSNYYGDTGYFQPYSEMDDLRVNHFRTPNKRSRHYISRMPWTPDYEEEADYEDALSAASQSTPSREEWLNFERYLQNFVREPETKTGFSYETDLDQVQLPEVEDDNTVEQAVWHARPEDEDAVDQLKSLLKTSKLLQKKSATLPAQTTTTEATTTKPVSSSIPPSPGQKEVPLYRPPSSSRHLPLPVTFPQTAESGNELESSSDNEKSSPSNKHTNQEVYNSIRRYFDLEARAQKKEATRNVERIKKRFVAPDLRDGLLSELQSLRYRNTKA